MDTETKSTRREPRLDKTSARQKAEALRGVLPNALKRIAKMEPNRTKESPALTALRPQSDEILALLKSGWSANAIATEIANAHETLYSVETLRNAIRRLSQEGGRANQSRTLPSPSNKQSAKTTRTENAGFAEDPR